MYHIRSRCFALFLLLTLMALPLGAAQVVNANRTSEPIRIDGVLSESVWRNQAASDFSQYEPQPAAPATERTEVWVAYDDAALYIAARLYDKQPDLISRNIGRRDASIESDWFWVGIDAYHDGRSGAFFAVNPVGTVRDGVLYNDTDNDDGWDGIWDVETAIDGEGWVVEMRIPYSQLRFDAADRGKESMWGINFRRTIHRKGEEDHFALMPKGESGYVSRFATLNGLAGINPPARLEVTPYVVGGARFLQHDPNDPFVTGRDPFGNVGADLRLGIGSSLTLDATVNPDFGQVEVDPAVVNLSAFETSYQEKRPFFLEGTGIFAFGTGNGNNGWIQPNFFYTRRIGRPPQGRSSHFGYADIPDRSTIIGAAKLTGRVADGWSVGLLSASTAREYAETDSMGIRFQDEVEPLSFYNVLRTSGEFDGGRQGIGMLATGVVRDLSDPVLARRLSSSAFSAGVDGWSYLDERRGWVVTGWGGVSNVTGSRERITALQMAPQRYFQQPDADHLQVDPNATSLSGWVGRVELRKRSGNFHVSGALGAISPGFDANDIGFNSRSDYINGQVSADYNWYEPDGLFRYKYVSGHLYHSYDFGGTILNGAYGVNAGGQFENFWGFDASIDYTPLTYDTRGTRGGPMIDGPAGWFGNFSGYSDFRKPVSFSVYGGGGTSPDDIWNVYMGMNVTVRPGDQIRISAGPNWSRNFNRSQYVDTWPDPLAVQTFGARYIFADLIQDNLSADIRIDWTFTPALSLQVYAQPYFAVGTYSNYKELARPHSYQFRSFGTDGSTLNVDDNTVTVDPDGDGESPVFTTYRPDYNYKSLRGTAVLRWEYRPGSTLYLAWTHQRADFADPGVMELGRDLKNLLNADGDNILLLKIAWWFNA